MTMSPCLRSLCRTVSRLLLPFYRESARIAVLRVTRFGAGYWIGGVCASLSGVALEFSPTFLFRTGMAGALVGMAMFGASFSVGGFVDGWRAQDRDKIVGGALGFVFCCWLSAALFMSFLRYYDSL